MDRTDSTKGDGKGGQTEDGKIGQTARKMSERRKRNSTEEVRRVGQTSRKKTETTTRDRRKGQTDG